MAIESLKQNLEREKSIINELFVFYSQLYNVEKLYPYEKRIEEKKVLEQAISSCFEQLMIINNSIPELVNSINLFKKIDGKVEEAKGLVKLGYNLGGKKVLVTIKEEDKKKFMEKLVLNRKALGKLEKEKKPVGKMFFDFRRARFYAKLSNRFFFKLSSGLVEKGKFAKLGASLRKSNMPYLLPSYLSMTFLSSTLALILGIIICIFLIIFSFSLNNLLIGLLLIPGLPCLTFFSYYFYPYAEKQSLGSKINQELPFVALHMSAIAGSGIEPSQIFRIVGLERDYPNTGKEVRKIINQVNVYGYDLISALKNTARETSSLKFAELLNGIATTISSGGSLNEFLDKRAETLLFEYRLEREKYAKSAETFMDVYISIVIAAPMILTLLLILMSVGGIGIGMSSGMLATVIILIVSLINVVFLAYLHLSQPAY
ncbi:MAG: type II secretion system F family protein [Candidatus Pacearchaeota archaeon]|nr:type II secretion system F family protein [Candidatus Pacearchaeota archaeon]